MTAPPPLKILVADDASVMRMLLRTMIARLVRAEITDAADGSTALKLAQETAFDLVFLDINMPNLSGLSVLDALRKQAAYRDRPIILLTALGQDSHRERGLALGATAYMLKPLREMELVRVLRKVVPHALAAAATRPGTPHGGDH